MGYEEGAAVGHALGAKVKPLTVGTVVTGEEEGVAVGEVEGR